MEPAESEDYRLSESGDKYLAQHFADLAMRIRREAIRLAAGKPIDANHVDLAWSRLGLPNLDIEDAQTIISRALRENRTVEWLAYGMAFVLFVAGIAGLSLGAFGSYDTAVRIASMISGLMMQTLLLMPLRLVVNCRRHNIAIQIIGLLLDKVDDPKKLSSLLSQVFRAVVVGDAPLASR